MKSASRPFVLGALLAFAWPLAAPGLHAQAASGRVCEGPDLHARVAADPRRVATADDRISLVPPEGFPALDDTIRAKMWDPPAVALGPDGPARIWLRYEPGPRLDAGGARAWLSLLERGVAERYSGITWIARDAVEVEGSTRWGIRLEFTGRSDGVDEHSWIWATPFETRTLLAVFAAPAEDARLTEEMARSVATLEVRDCTVRWPLAAFLDSAALVRAVSELPEPLGLPAGVRPLFEVSYDSVGAGVKVGPVVVDQIPESYAGPVAAAIRAHLKPRPPFPGRRVFTLRVAAGPQPLVDSPEVATSPPAPRGGERERLRRELMRLPRRDAPSTGYRYIVEVRVLADGTVDPAFARLIRSTGVPQLDDDVLRIVRTLRFAPGTVEGVPVAVQLTVPIEMGPG